MKVGDKILCISTKTESHDYSDSYTINKEYEIKYVGFSTLCNSKYYEVINDMKEIDYWLFSCKMFTNNIKKIRKRKLLKIKQLYE